MRLVGFRRPTFRIRIRRGAGWVRRRPDGRFIPSSDGRGASEVALLLVSLDNGSEIAASIEVLPAWAIRRLKLK